MRYLIEDTLYPTNTPLLMRWPDDRFPERYDYDSKKWVPDIVDRIYRVCIGEILVNNITEEEVNEIIKNVK